MGAEGLVSLKMSDVKEMRGCGADKIRESSQEMHEYHVLPNLMLFIVYNEPIGNGEHFGAQHEDPLDLNLYNDWTMRESTMVRDCSVNSCA